MSLTNIPLLLDALKLQLTTALAAAGIAENEEDDPPGIPVFTSVTSTKSRMYARIDPGTMLQGNSKFGTSDRHSFTVRVVHVADTNSDVIARPEHEVTRVAGLVSGALKGWAPLPSATKIQFLGGFPAEEETPETCSYVCRFLVHITGD